MTTPLNLTAPPTSVQQIIPLGSETRVYNPARDVAHNFRFVIELVIARLDNHVFPELDAMLKRSDVSDEEIGEALNAVILFAGSPPRLGAVMQDTLETSGLNACKREAYLGVAAMLGTVMLGMYWAGAREATMGGEGPPKSAQELLGDGAQFLAAMSKPRWRRRFDRWKARVKNVYVALRGAST